MRSVPLATTRRSLLIGSGAVVLALATAACTSDDSTASISPDQAALDAALAGELTLAAAFEAGVVGTERQQQRGRSAARSHRSHAQALTDAGARITTTPTSTATATPAPREARELARRQRAQADRLDRLALGVSPRIALLLGSIAASDAATASLLGQGR